MENDAVLKTQKKCNLPGPGPGRPAGLPNKATQQGRDAIARFVDGNAERLGGWLDRIAEDDPQAAFTAFMSVVEYHIPKLQRTETKIEGEIKNTYEVIN